jgi:hypothetical protein
MAKPVYKFWRSRPTEAWYQLSEEEQNKLLAKGQEALQKVGGKTLIMCTPGWSNEAWLLCGVEEFPDRDALEQHTMLLFEIEHFRYFNGESIVGVEYPLE